MGDSNSPSRRQSALMKAVPVIFSWDLNPFDYEYEVLQKYTEDIFQYYDILNKYKIEISKFRDFFIQVQSLYHNNPFHNFQHVWSVFQISFLILQNGADRFLHLDEIFATLVAALCHDLDHPGNNNAFEKSINSELYQKYQNNAVLECHHKWMTRKLFEQSHLNLLSELPLSQQEQILDILDGGIMATDMAQHFALMDVLETHTRSDPNFDIENESDRKLLVGLIVHAADLSGQALKREIALFWGSKVTQEFINQSVKETELSLPLSPWMLGLENEITKLKMQRGFVETFIIPQWTLMSLVVPSLTHCKDNAISNFEFYDMKIKELESPVTDIILPTESGT